MRVNKARSFATNTELKKAQKRVEMKEAAVGPSALWDLIYSHLFFYPLKKTDKSGKYTDFAHFLNVTKNECLAAHS
jgi:hypothetical protein